MMQERQIGGTNGMRHILRPHPDYPCLAATSIDVNVELLGRDCVALDYVVTGTIDDLQLSPVLASGRSDRLWENTCFEVFIRPGAGDGYYEFNFAPSTQWAAYHFSRYRGGRRDVTEIDALAIDVQSGARRYALRTRLKLDRLPELARSAAWRLGLSTIIKETNGRKSYWALAHPPGDADFHHADCFAHELCPA